MTLLTWLKTKCFLVTIKFFIDFAGSDGLIQTLVVYGALLCREVLSKIPALIMVQQYSALQKVPSTLKKQLARSHMLKATAFCNHPGVLNIERALMNTPVQDYRPELDWRDGAVCLQWVHGDDCYFILPPPSDLMKFHSTVKKSYLGCGGNSNLNENTTEIVQGPLDFKIDSTRTICFQPIYFIEQQQPRFNQNCCAHEQRLPSPRGEWKVRNDWNGISWWYHSK